MSATLIVGAVLLFLLVVAVGVRMYLRSATPRMLSGVRLGLSTSGIASSGEVSRFRRSAQQEVESAQAALKQGRSWQAFQAAKRAQAAFAKSKNVTYRLRKK